MKYYQYIPGKPLPSWLVNDYPFEVSYFSQYDTSYVSTPEGVKELKRGDFIVRVEDYSLRVYSEKEFLEKQWE